MPTEVPTIGVRVGAGVGVCVGAGIGVCVGAGAGIWLGADVGMAVGVYVQTLLTQLPPPKQSESIEQADPRAHGGHESPPQSTSVSPIEVSRTLFVHPTRVG